MTNSEAVSLLMNNQYYERGYKQGVSDVLDKVRAEIEHTGAYEQEIYGKTEFLKGIDYCIGVIDKYRAESEG